MIVSLSILNIEKEKRYDKINEFMQTENNWIHFDVMDGNFVENKTFRYEVVKEINQYCHLFKDVHLMTYNPQQYLNQYKEAGTDSITFHYESIEEENIIPLIKKIQNLNMKAGISIKPSTNIEKIKEYLPILDLVLVMSVEPGKGGQKFIESSLEKIKWLKENKGNYNYLISVDGGINDVTSKLVKQAGADIIVVGTYLTKDIITKEKVLNLN